MSRKLKFYNRINQLDKLVSRIHKEVYHRFPWQTVLVCFSIYLFTILHFHEYLKISCNYFVLLPLTAAAVAYGFPGGIIAGVLALPINLIFFYQLGHPEYAPESHVIAFISGILMGTILGYLSDYFRKLTNEIERRIQVESDLRDALSDKDVLLSEINHRVRNNLGIINSLIQLHANRISREDQKKEFEKLRKRVLSISQVYEQLYMENQTLTLDIRNYLESLITNLIEAAGDCTIDLKVTKPSQEVLLNSDRVLHLGLIAQEIVMNSLKYAFTPACEGELILRMEISGSNLLVEIKDSGPGFDQEQVERGLGTRLIDALSHSLNAEHSWECGEHCSFKIILPLED
ncbi:MAG: sensor histidine kinase [Spirochaetales bacterium]|nr:sensor histidine kinase [Spirochaetales bacterium]